MIGARIPDVASPTVALLCERTILTSLILNFSGPLKALQTRPAHFITPEFTPVNEEVIK